MKVFSLFRQKLPALFQAWFYHGGVLLTATAAAAPGDLDPTFQVRGLPAGSSWPAIQTFAIQRDDRVLLGGSVLELDGRMMRGLARLQPNGAIDLSYAPNLNSRNPSAGLRVHSMVLLPDDRVVFDAAELTDINGVGSRGTKDWAPARLWPDGRLDDSFLPGGHQATGVALNSEIRVLAAYARGAILVQADGLRRLTDHGSVDPSWPRTDGDPVIPGYFLCAGVQGSDRAVVFGQFNASSDMRDPRLDRLHRLQPDGTPDPTFIPWQPILAGGVYGGGQLPTIRQVLVLPDDKLLLVGTFTWLRQGTNVYQRGSIARLNADGTMDEGFASAMGFSDVYVYPEIPQWNTTNSRAAYVAALAPDGKVLVGGHFNSYAGVPRPNLARLNTDGTLDSVFAPPLPDRSITQVGVQSDGNVIVSSAAVVGAGGLSPYRGGAGLIRLIGGPLTPSLPRIVQQPVTRSVTVPAPNMAEIQFSITAESPMTPSFQWFHNGLALNDGVGISGARTSILTLRNADRATAGRYHCEVANTAGRVASEPALLYVNDSASPVQDLVSPLLQVNAPETASFRTANALITFRGLASDNVGLAQVLMQKDGGPLQSVHGLSTWQAVSDLTPGTNRFQFRAVDLAGNPSATITRTVIYVVMKGFELTIHGQGNVNRPTFGASLEAGRSYTLQATPKPGNLFSNWVVNGQVYSEPTLRFTLTNDLQLAANFVPNPFPALVGTYSGLFFDPAKPEHAGAGALNLKVTAQGAVSGKALTAGKVLPLRGRLHLDLQADCGWTTPNGQPADLHLQWTQGSETVTGSVTWPGRMMAVNAYRAGLLLDPPPNEAPLRFTAVLSLPDSDSDSDTSAASPLGTGHAMLQVDRRGTMRMKGLLGDGLPWTTSGSLSASGHFPVYVAFPAGHGSIFGWLSLARTETNDVHGTLIWTRPGMFTNQVRLAGSRHEVPRPGERWLDAEQGVIIRDGGNLSSSATNSAAFNSSFEVLIAEPNPDGLSLSFKPITGTLVGRFENGAGKATSIKGVVLQKQGVGVGFFSGTNRAGSLFLGPIERYPLLR